MALTTKTVAVIAVLLLVVGFAAGWFLRHSCSRSCTSTRGSFRRSSVSHRICILYEGQRRKEGMLRPGDKPPGKEDGVDFTILDVSDTQTPGALETGCGVSMQKAKIWVWVSCP